MGVNLGRGVLFSQFEQDFHVEQILSHLPIYRAKKIERQRQLEDQLINHDKVAHRHRAFLQVRSSLAYIEEEDEPLTTPWAAKNMAVVKALENMMFCPEFKNANDVLILTDDSSYCAKYRSYCAISYFSLLKCY
jgi:hypothetical protein